MRYTSPLAEGARAWDVATLIAFALGMEFSAPIFAQTLTLQHGTSENDVVLNWSGGTSPFTLYMSSDKERYAGVETLLQDSSQTSYTESGQLDPGQIVYFRVGDSLAPVATITSPSAGSSTTDDNITVSGTIESGVARVWVSGQRALVTGSTFSADNVLLALGSNTLYATAISSSGNITTTSSTVTKVAGNQAPVIQIMTPANGSDITDVTPVIEVTYSDAEGPLDNGITFRAYLDGMERTAAFNPRTSTNATWSVSNVDALGLGMHVLVVTIKDIDGFTQSASSRFRVVGPRLLSIVPNRGLPLDSILLNGSGFGSPGVDTTVFFNDTPATVYFGSSATHISLQVPPTVTDGPVTVRVNGIDSNPQPFDIAFSVAGSAARGLAIAVQNGPFANPQLKDRVYYVDNTGHNVLRLEQKGSPPSVFFTTTFNITGIDFDPEGETLWVVARGDPSYSGMLFDYLTGYIYSVASNGVATLRHTLPANTYADPGGIDVGLFEVYVGAIRPDQDLVFLEIDLLDGTRTVWDSFPLTGTIMHDVEVGPSFTRYAIARPPAAGGALYRNGAPFYTLGNNLGSTTIDCLNAVYVTDQGTGQVLKINGAQSATSIASLGAGSNPSGIDLDSMGSFFVGTSSSVRRLDFSSLSCMSQPSAMLTGDSDRIFADTDPTTTAAEDPNVQFVVLTGCLTDQLQPRSEVAWDWEDVDDPATDVTLDSNGSDPNDNLGTFDGSPAFTQEGSYTLTVLPGGPFPYRTIFDGNACSKIRFHTSDAPGDNFRVTALVGGVDIVPVKSKIMTVWKRLHVEVDSMGEVNGIIEVDDAVTGDVPNPDVLLLTSAFAAAYVDVLNEGTGIRTEVDFNHHVPDLSGTPEGNAEIVSQGGLGRDRASLTGSWAVYAQGGYEGYEDKDGDPDSLGDEITLGVTNRLNGKYSFVFSEVIRDLVEFGPSLDERYSRRALLLHELGHQFGLANADSQDGSGGIMEGELNWAFPYFNATQLRTIRCIGQSGMCGVPGTLE